MRGGNRRAPDPRSARSDRLGVRFGKLPRAGFTGRVPAWPLSKATARERALWRWAWRTPQAAAWASEPWRWESVALWVRWTVKIEDPAATASAGTVAVRLADQIGLTPAGLRDNRWEIEEAPTTATAQVPAREPVAPSPPPSVPLKQRLRVVQREREAADG